MDEKVNFHKSKVGALRGWIGFEYFFKLFELWQNDTPI